MYLLAYDVETANNKNVGSICAVGWAFLDNDRIIDHGYSLINPGCSFSKMNTAIHGITADDVKDAPAFSEYWEATLSQFMRKSIVIAHNAGFDMSATEQALFNSSIPDPGITYIDSLQVAQAFFDSDSYKLCDLAALAGHAYNEHNAGEDALALVRVLEYLRDSNRLEDIASLLLRSGCSLMNTASNRYVPHKITLPSPPAAFRSHCSEDVTPVDGLFACMRFCITGDVPGYERADVERIIMEHSGKPTGAVSGKTDYLIVGEFEGCCAGYVSGKMKKALELQEQGKRIQIIRPDEFFAMIEKK